MRMMQVKNYYRKVVTVVLLLVAPRCGALYAMGRLCI